MTMNSPTPFTVRHQGRPWTPRTPLDIRPCISPTFMSLWPLWQNNSFLFCVTKLPKFVFVPFVHLFILHPSFPSFPHFLLSSLLFSFLLVSLFSFLLFLFFLFFFLFLFFFPFFLLFFSSFPFFLFSPFFLLLTGLYHGMSRSRGAPCLRARAVDRG